MVFFANAVDQPPAYRIPLAWWMFAAGGGIAFLIAVATVSVQALRTALANPVEALRYE